MRLLSFDIDGTLEIGEPPGIVPVALVRTAQHLGYLNIETGAMYRALALKALQTGTALDDAGALEALARDSRLELVASPAGNRVLLDGRDVSQRIREADVTEAASRRARTRGVLRPVR